MQKLRKKIKIPKKPEFIVINEYAEVFIGLRGGYPEFSNNWDEAKPLTNPECIKNIQYGTNSKVEIHYL